MRILRLLATRPLPCGCLVGIHETYDGPAIALLEARADGCHDDTHRTGAPVEPLRPAQMDDEPEFVPAGRAVR